MIDIVYALLGGTVIGLAASMMLIFNGKIAGISGIFGGLLKGVDAGDGAWRVAFVGGLLTAGVLASFFAPERVGQATGRSFAAIGMAGLLVGFGVRMGNGCTSGHGICGLTRFSRRSAVATGTFMGTGAMSAVGAHLLFGGVL